MALETPINSFRVDPSWQRIFKDGRTWWDGQICPGAPPARGGGIHVQLVEGGSQPAEVLVQNPPDTLRAHPHGPCLQLLRPVSAGWYRLHFVVPPDDADGAYGYICKMAKEAQDASCAGRSSGALAGHGGLEWVSPRAIIAAASANVVRLKGYLHWR